MAFPKMAAALMIMALLAGATAHHHELDLCLTLKIYGRTGNERARVETFSRLKRTTGVPATVSDTLNMHAQYAEYAQMMNVSATCDEYEYATCDEY